MRIRKILIGILTSILVILGSYIACSYIYDLKIKENRIKNIEKLENNFDIEVKQIYKSKEFKYNKNVENKVEEKSEIETGQEKAIGKIIINKLNLNYPILDGSTDENLDISITKFYGSNINSVGNCVLAGHNMKDGTLFGRISELENNDEIELINGLGIEEKYKIFNIKIVEPTDLTVLEQADYKMVTLITCTDSGKKRLIVQARVV